MAKWLVARQINLFEFSMAREGARQHVKARERVTVVGGAHHQHLPGTPVWSESEDFWLNQHVIV